MPLTVGNVIEAMSLFKFVHTLPQNSRVIVRLLDKVDGLKNVFI
jgi:hypothetical protein